MSESLVLTPGASREERYRELLPQIASVIGDETDRIAVLANIAAMLYEGLGFLWVGFYRKIGDELILGPFQGPLACTRIAMGKGVCGTAAQQRTSLIVDDVNAFAGHIACSSASRSEIVLPLVEDGELSLVLDVDSDKPADFSETDRRHLEQVLALIPPSAHRV